MIYSQHTDPIIVVPQHISRYGLYSAQLILLNAICNYIYGYNILTIIGLSSFNDFFNKLSFLGGIFITIFITIIINTI